MKRALVALLVLALEACASSGHAPRTVRRPSGCAGGSYLECVRVRDQADMAARDLREIRRAQHGQARELRRLRRAVEDRR